ncbi:MULTISPECIES: septal ring lytic transglycosylase RlpA family protein [unclassified Aureimonas]|uniref:septal ring lytic transglycosylase RlpA family protein n=1 Tax=unclassified Aureimonas TaxID=2615206 RepID=UPI000B02F1F5|nr:MULTISPECIES: septal ring lytic transglycosylase RlpA family protein [unclassified Aureimonas]
MMTAGGKVGRRIALSMLVIAGVSVSGCQSGSSTHGGGADDIIHSDPNESFSSKEFGVSASPRVTNKRIVRKGGGRDQVGKPYKVRGKWYYPKEEPGYVKTGEASWYGSSFHGRLTANGEVYDMFGLSAAHPTFPLPSYAKVTNLKNGSEITVRVNDRGPYHEGRVMDLSSKAAELLGYKQDGIGEIKVEYAGRAPLEGDDTKMLMASYHPGNVRAIDSGLPSGVMVAMNEERAPRFPAMTRKVASPDLPGVRPDAVLQTQPATIDEVTVGSIIGQAARSEPGIGAIVPKPAARQRIQPLVVSSFAEAPKFGGAAGALDTLASRATATLRKGERIEIGAITDAALVAAIRDLAKGHGKLVADADPAGGAATLALDLKPSEDADALLAQLWQAGASDAFVLRD